MAVYFFIKKNVITHRPKNAPTADNRQNLDPNRKILVCVGDSNTHGNVSYNWVDDLVNDFPAYQILNAGINADLTNTLLKRLNDTIACKPNYITLLIGTNDVQATMSQKQEKRYREMNKIGADETSNFETFCQNYSKIIQRLKTETYAKIAVFSLPILGEDLINSANIKGDKYSNFIKEIAQNEDLIYLPLREMQKEYLKQNPPQSKYTYEDTFMVMNLSILKNIFLERSWDKISEEHGFMLTPDNIHQNSISGKMILELVQNFIKTN